MENHAITIDTIYNKVLILKNRSKQDNTHKLFYEILSDLKWIKAEMEVDRLIQKAARGEELFSQPKE